MIYAAFTVCFHKFTISSSVKGRKNQSPLIFGHLFESSMMSILKMHSLIFTTSNKEMVQLLFLHVHRVTRQLSQGCVHPYYLVHLQNFRRSSKQQLFFLWHKSHDAIICIGCFIYLGADILVELFFIKFSEYKRWTDLIFMSAGKDNKEIRIYSPLKVFSSSTYDAF